MAVELTTPILGLWSVLRFWIRLVDGVGQAGRFRGRERVAEAEKLVLGQVPFPSAFSILLDALGRVAGGVHMPMSCRPAPNCRENGKRPVRLRPTVGVSRLFPSWGKMWSRKALS